MSRCVAAAGKRVKKHKSPGTAPGPLPLDVPPGKPVRDAHGAHLLAALSYADAS
jgi:hypothetical protein